jgi:hypothetical protein
MSTQTQTGVHTCAATRLMPTCSPSAVVSSSPSTSSFDRVRSTFTTPANDTAVNGTSVASTPVYPQQPTQQSA